MKGLTAGVLTVGIALGLGAGIAQAQKWTGSGSLSAETHQLKAQRAESSKKPRMSTNDALISLQTASEQPSPSTVTMSPSVETAASAEDKTNQAAGASLAGKDTAIPVKWGKSTLGEDYIDRMSKVQVVPERSWNDPQNSPSVAKPVQFSSPPRELAAAQIRQNTESDPTSGWAKAKFRFSAETAQATDKAAKQADQSPAVQARKAEASGPHGEWAKAKYRAAEGARSASGEPGPIAASAINAEVPPRQDLGYVERGDGKVEAIVAEGEHIGLVEETEEFMKNFHFPAPSPAELEMALAPPPSNPPEAGVPGADQPQPSEAASAPEAGAPAAENGTDVAQLQRPEAPPADNAQSQSEAALGAEPLADYAGTQVRPTPPENLQPANAPAFVTAAPDITANRSSVTPIGYVEKAGGEKEAIVAFQDQVFLVHEGELFAGKYRVLRVTALAVEIVEEPTQASSAAIDRPRNIQALPKPQ